MLFTLKPVSSRTDYAHSVKFLGVVLDSGLTWKEHTVFVCRSVSRNIFLLRNLKSCLSQSTVLMAYHALVHSSITYAILVWGHSAHAPTVLSYREDCRNVFKKFGILTLPCAYILQCLVHLKTNLFNYTKNESIHSYETRSGGNMRMDFLRLSRTRNGTDYYALKFFNVLPIAIRLLDRTSFKSVIKRFLLENAFYDFDEFLLSDFTHLRF